jgi:hypothetical protein
MFTCSLFIAAIKGKMTGFNLLGNPDIQTTAEATKEETVTCKLFCRIVSNDKKKICEDVAMDHLEKKK